MTQRLYLYDALRGFSVISMVLFHLCYDLQLSSNVDMSFFTEPFISIWRNSISWAFVFIAGAMFNHSHNNFKRASKYLVVALLIFIVTSVARFDTPINFGIIFCMGSSTLSYACLYQLYRFTFGKKLHVTRSPHFNFFLSACLFILFLMCLPLAQGYIAVVGHKVFLPAFLYQSPALSWLGFPGPHFSSGDYYPLLPYLLLYGSGLHFDAGLRQRSYPACFTQSISNPLETVGRHALGMYLLHQPVIIALLYIAGVILL